MEHDQLFKELLTTFFHEFIQLFFPNVAAFLEPDVRVVPLQQVILDDIERGQRNIRPLA